MKKLLAVVLTFLLISFLHVSCSLNFDFNEAMEKNWGVRIPYGYKEMFSKDSGPSFHGDGWRYNVFYYKENLNVEELEQFTMGKNTGIEHSIGDILNILKVPMEERPNFAQNYHWYRKISDRDSRNKLYLVYFEETSLLYVVQDIY